MPTYQDSTNLNLLFSMTTLTDLQVLGELGWTLQIIYDKSGLIPTFWRPPYGKSVDPVSCERYRRNLKTDEFSPYLFFP